MNNLVISDELLQSLEKALNTTSGTGGDFLPLPLAQEYIDMIREQNWLRQLFTEVPMVSKTRDIPKVLSKAKVYYESAEGTSARQTSFTTGTLRLEAVKYMSYISATQEVLEDAAATFDLANIIEQQLVNAVAAAEEETMMVGNTSQATTATESAATSTTWYEKDHRLAFDGLLTLSSDIAGSKEAGTRAADRVDAGGNIASTALVREMIYELGKYGKNYNNLVLVLNSWSANELLDDDNLVTIDKYGPNATIVTGEIGKLYGKVAVIDSAYMTSQYGVLTHISNPKIGDRRMVSIKNEEKIETDSRIYVVTQRLAFDVEHKDALCQIHSLNAPSTTS